MENNSILDILTYALNEDGNTGDFTVSPVVAYFCFDSVDFDFEKIDEIIEEDIYSDIRKEQKYARRKKVSSVTGTTYKLSSEQKRALKYLKKKYGKALINEIKKYRKETLAPYQVAKSYMEKSKALYPKEVFGMTREEYEKYKKSAEKKITNMRSNKYMYLAKDAESIANKKANISNIESYIKKNGVSDTDPILNKIFKKYGIASTRYTEHEMREFRDKIDNVESIKKELLAKIITLGGISDEDRKKLSNSIKEIGSKKKELSGKSVNEKEKQQKELANKFKEMEKLNAVGEITVTIKSSDIPVDKKDELEDFMNSKTNINGTDITGKSFEQEYENFLFRERIRNEIRKKYDSKNDEFDITGSKYLDDFEKMFDEMDANLESRRKDIIAKMADERESKTLNDYEKKIYELKPYARKDSDRLSDYTLKIRDEDFFDPKYYNKSEEFKEAERKVEASIKRFERSLESKMEASDYQLLKKYRLISNLMVIKNENLNNLYNKNKNKGDK